MSATLLRFWWVVAMGIVIGVGLATWMVYEIPGFQPREQPVYTAPARLFVTSAEGQYLRVSVPRVAETGGSTGSGGAAGASGAGGGPVVLNQPPNVQPLLAAANLYPLLIESDNVARLRQQMFGPIPGTVQASAYSAVSTPSRYAPAQIPVIDVFATSPTRKQAIALADATVVAFKVWIKKQQSRARLDPEERVLIQELRAPRVTIPSGGPSYGIPILVALAVVAAFGMLAFVLDQLVPRGAQVPQLQPQPQASIPASEKRRRWA